MITIEERRRRAAINYYLRQGLTREQAEAKYDIPRGVCQECKGPAHSDQARMCVRCQKKKDYRRCLEYQKRVRSSLREKPLKPETKLPTLSQLQRDASGRGPKKPKPGAKPDMPTPSADRLAADRRTAKPETIITPAGAKVKRVPSMMPVSLRRLFPEAGEEGWDASL